MSGNFFTVGHPPYGEKYFQMLFLIAQIECFWTLNATQKKLSLLQSNNLAKINKNCQKLAVFNKNAFWTIFRQFS